MPGSARKDIVAADEVSIYHCRSRCVRRAFLCGEDALSERDLNYRKGWVQERLQHVASVFAVEVCSYSIMSNHLHVILRIRPDLVATWSDEFVVRRWGALRLAQSKSSPDPLTDEQVRDKLADKQLVAELRTRLSSLSCFMGQLNEYVARAANAEDEVTGHFWEGRFRCVRLLDLAALLACSVYVDLNPIRARVAKTPETSQFTSVYDRIQDVCAESAAVAGSDRKSGATSGVEADSATRAGQADWLVPIAIADSACSEAAASASASAGSPRRRASDLGLLPMSVEDYIQLVDWTGRQQRADKPGAMPEHVAPIFQRLGVETDSWLKLTSQFTRMFASAAGKAKLVTAAAERAQKRWFQGIRNCRASFGS